MAVVQEYIDLVTSEHYNKPNFIAYLTAFLEKLQSVTELYDSFDILFNLENAVGDQLDIIGNIVGISRNLPVEEENIPDTLDDDLYRYVIKSRIYFNHWNGTREGLEATIEAVFPDLQYEIVDDQDMSYEVTIINPLATTQEIALLKAGYILPKPSGVRVNYEVINKPYFGFDADTDFVKGWDKGTWRKK